MANSSNDGTGAAPHGSLKTQTIEGDIPLYVRGEAVYLDDIPEPADLLHGAVFPSPTAHGKIKALDLEKARQCPGVTSVITYKDIPGENRLGAIIRDETLLAEDRVVFAGEPLALVTATTRDQARRAAAMIRAEISYRPVITDPREAFAAGHLVAPPRTFRLGNTEDTWDRCDVIVEGRVDTGAQEHFYLEPQGAMAIPTENGGVRIYSSTQSPTGVQRAVARVLGIPMNRVEVDVGRLGGGFGGKEEQATHWACLAALAAINRGKPVKLVPDRHQDMLMTGKRHPYSADYKIGLTADARILAYEVTFYQNAGAAADLSTAILERSLFHVTNSYYIPNVTAVAASCRTNLVPFTAFRGFGGPQAMFVMEAALRKAAETMKVSPSVIQWRNLLKEGDSFPYGMPVENCRAQQCWREAAETYEFARIFNGVETFNAEHRLKKKGVAVMPVCFGISFTSTALNQAGALVNVYTDGSVGVATGAVEMGQGVNTKIRNIAARTFSIAPGRVKLETTNTTRVANTSPSAASATADLNGRAVENACREILRRLKMVAAQRFNHPNAPDIDIRDERVWLEGEQTDLTWEKLVDDAYWCRTNLAARGFYATPGIYFDRPGEKGKPFAYHVFGTAITEVTLDCLRGTYVIDAVRIVHDGGESLDPLIDRGQVEGGLLQGIGWVTMEEVMYGGNGQKGKLLTDTTSTYKIPDIHSIPGEIAVRFLENADNPRAVMNSKAVGEPPFMYGIGTYFALVDALKAFRPDGDMEFSCPLTPEKALMYLYS